MQAPKGIRIRQKLLAEPEDDSCTACAAFDGERPEDLWAFMERYEKETRGQILAIPHNANVSNGRMFAVEDSSGKPIAKAYAQQRIRWGPIVEVTQIKGDGEVHPLLSPDDEFADFETWDMGNRAPTSPSSGRSRQGNTRS